MRIKAPRPTREEVCKMLEDGSLIEQFQDMIYKIAHNMREAHLDEDFNELVSEGYWGIMEYVPRYDPEKAALSTWVYKSAWDQMKTFCIKPSRHRLVFTDPQDNIFVVKAQENWFSSFLKMVGEDAGLLARAAVEAPEELHHAVRERAPVGSKKALKSYMEENFGWGDVEFNKAIGELSACL